MKMPASAVVASGLRLRRQLGILGATALGVAAFAGPAQAAGIGLHGPVDFANPTDPFGHLPSYYEDADGQRLQLCLDTAATCAITPPDAGMPVSFPDNFPDEIFYSLAQATIGTKLQLTIAQEANFDAATPGSQAVFGRLRIRDQGGDLTAGEWYRFTTPAGEVEVQADPAKSVFYTTDIGCGPVIGLACDSDAAFDAAGASQIGTTFLQWDRGSGAAPPTGYLGDNATPHAIVGSTFVPAGETQPANYFRVEHLSEEGGSVIGLVGETDQFTVLGKLASGSDAAGVLVNSDGTFGTQRINTTIDKRISLRNGGSGKVDIDSLTIGGADADQFTIDTSMCDDGTMTLEPGQSCSVLVSFTPDGTGPREATIDAAQGNSSGTVTHSFKLTGTGVVPVLSLPSLISYGNQLVGDTVGPRVVEVRNTGTDTMHVNAATLAGPGAGDYALGLNTCTATDVAPGATCIVQVFFRPSASGAADATLAVSTDVGTKSVTISGAGVTNPGDVTVIREGGTPAAGPAATSGASLAAPLVVPEVGSTLPKLSLKSLGGAAKVKRAKAGKSGIRLALRVQDGTEVVRVRVYRRTAGGRKLLSAGYKTIGSGSLVHVSQNHAALRRSLRILGRYEVEVTPGRSTSDLGNASTFSFRVVK